MTAPSEETPGLSREEIRRETSISLCADILDRAPAMSIGDLQILLVQITDSGLIAFDSKLQDQASGLADEAEAIIQRLRETFPGAHKKNLLLPIVSLENMVTCCRSEQLWVGGRDRPLQKAEAVLADVYSLYRQVYEFQAMLDSMLPGGGGRARPLHPVLSPNPFESLS